MQINILSYLILSYLILSYLILSYLILSYLILSYLILSYLILSYNIASDGHLPTEDTDHLRTVGLLGTLLKKSSNIGAYGQYRTLRMCAFVWTEFTLIFLDP